jgi:hypothetical protein
MKKLSKSFIVFFVLISQISLSQEEVEKHPLLTDKFVFSGGLFFPTKEIKISVNGASIDNDIDLGKEFDIRSYQSTYNLGFDWRFSRKWKLSADYFNMRNVKVADLAEPIKWEDYIFDGEVTLGVNIGVLRTMVSRIISQGDKHELGVGIGFHIMPINIYVEGRATLEGPDGTVIREGERQSLSVTAPLPDIGLYYNWAPTSKWFFLANVDFLYVAIGDYKGWLWDFNAGVKYQIVDFFGVGVNYKYYRIDFEVDKGNEVGEWQGSLGVSYSGPIFLVHFNF